LQVVFYATETGHEPVREWLKSLLKEEKKAIGEDIKTVQFGWPIGMPVVKKLEKGIWEVRTELNNKISRILFTVYEENIVLLHGFIKKSQKTPGEDLDLARKRARDVRGG
ncbi:MAG: type II toxin-antitoxin system RelE/ParE family toxin, partial [Candidatus Omnitrophota bacterium]|nr:type II toxin-antitoxin system RelE/ParE family toxin [Candidatus Omnitrophota bacterium]